VIRSVLGQRLGDAGARAQRAGSGYNRGGRIVAQLCCASRHRLPKLRVVCASAAAPPSRHHK
jgi:hypothetical protein